MTFFQKLEIRIKRCSSLLCVGLDPRIDGKGPYAEILAQNKRLIELTAEYTACYKPNIAFYEKYGENGIKALKDTLALIPDDIPVLLDAKRGDIGATAEAYASSVFNDLKADAVTLSPYMGLSSAGPFFEYKDKGFFFLCRTSNPGADEIQELPVAAPGRRRALYLEIAAMVSKWSDRAGLVVKGNDPDSLSAVREALPNIWILAPGIGAQGGKADEAAFAGVRGDGMGLLPVVVRSIAQAEDPAQKAREYRDAINEAVKKALEKRKTITAASVTTKQLKAKFMDGLLETGCFKTGSFTLKSGKISPFYIDLRRTSSSARLMWTIGEIFADALKDIECDRIAGIPVAGLPLATAASMISGIPMIFPRMVKKAHGSGNDVEGEFKAGEKVVLLDDLITTGKSKLEAAEILRGAGLIVDDLVVLLERGAQGRKDMYGAGIRLHSFMIVDDLFNHCFEKGVIDQNTLDELLDYVKD